MFKTAEGKAKKDPAMHIRIARAYYGSDPAAYAKEIDKRLEKARRINIQAPEIFIFEGDMLADKKTGATLAANTRWPQATTLKVRTLT